MVIRMINSSRKTLEAELKTYKIKQSPSMDGTKLDARVAKKQSQTKSCRASDRAAQGHQTNSHIV